MGNEEQEKILSMSLCWKLFVEKVGFKYVIGSDYMIECFRFLLVLVCH